MTVPPTVSTVHQRSKRIIWHVHFGTGIITDKTVPLNCPDITLIEKTNKTVRLFGVSMTNSSNVQTAYTEKTRLYAEISTAM